MSTKKHNFRFYKNEAYLQGEIYHLCKLANIPCYLEVCLKINSLKNVRLDAVIDFYETQFVIECKYSDEKIDFEKYLPQLKTYLRLGHPVFLITNLHEVKELIHFVLADFKFENEIYVYSQNFKIFRKFNDVVY